MAGSVFLIDGKGDAVSMTEKPYESEAALQELLARYPNLLSGDETDLEAPRRWILVDREVGVPDEPDGRGRWAVDHLFLDQDGVPTLVEVKRQTDTRIRREVVGQMLDYAANASTLWSTDRVKAAFEARCAAEGRDPDQIIASHLDGSGESQDFWQKVKTNLQAGRVRLVFVADEIPTELRRIIEFLNTQMDPAEVLGVEVRQYIGGGQKAVVPRVLGQTAAALQRKQATQDHQWDEASLLASLGERHGRDAARVAQELVGWAQAKGLDIWWGRGQRSGSFLPILHAGKDWFTGFAVWTYGTVEIQFQHMRNRAPYDDPTKRLALVRALNSIDGVRLPEDAIDRRPGFDLKLLGSTSSFEQFTKIFEGVFSDFRTSGERNRGSP